MNDLIIRIFHHCECYSFIGERDTITFYVKKAPLAWNSTLIGKFAHHAFISSWRDCTWTCTRWYPPLLPLVLPLLQAKIMLCCFFPLFFFLIFLLKPKCTTPCREDVNFSCSRWLPHLSLYYKNAKFILLSQ